LSRCLTKSGLHITPQVAVDSKNRPRVVWDRDERPIQTTGGKIIADLTRCETQL